MQRRRRPVRRRVGERAHRTLDDARTEIAHELLDERIAVNLLLGLALACRARGRIERRRRTPCSTSTATSTGLPSASASAAFSFATCAASAYCGTGTESFNVVASTAVSSLLNASWYATPLSGSRAASAGHSPSKPTGSSAIAGGNGRVSTGADGRVSAGLGVTRTSSGPLSNTGTKPSSGGPPNISSALSGT